MKHKKTAEGVKGFALCFILLYMAFSQVFLGGHLGYQLLFALLGLETFRSYITEKTYSGPFFIKKVRAYWPELLAMVTVVTALYALFFYGDLPVVRGQALWSLVFANNLFQTMVGHPLSIRQLSPFGHLWFVSLLMQCYFLFALMILGKKSRQKIVSTAFFGGAISILSALVMGIYGGLGLADARIFYSPESRLFSFFVLLPAVLYELLGKGRGRTESREMPMLGIIILFVIFVLFMAEATPAYLGGLFVTSLLLSVFLLFLFRDGNAFESVFQFPLFTFLGERAYSIYLYSMPAFFFMEAFGRRFHLSGGVWISLAFVLLLVAAQASHYLFQVKGVSNKWVYVGLTAVFGGIMVMSFSGQSAAVMKVKKQEKKIVKTVETGSKKKESVTERFEPSNELAAAIEQVNAQKPYYKLTNEDLGKLQSEEGLLLGDSAAQSAREAYLRLMPNLQIQGSTNLNPSWYVSRIKEYTADGSLILQIGNDSALSYDAVEEIVQAAEGRPMFLFNVVADPQYEDKNNDILRRIADKYANVFLIDWNKDAKNQSGFFDEDGKLKDPATRLMSHMLGHCLLYNKPVATAKPADKEAAEHTKTEKNLAVKENDDVPDVGASN
ncbi:MAG: acyltransferase family protein [Peptoniphilus sp.]|nr:acyltransferase family protein [Peptoniphilus sp.]MDY3118913.1 acyltransferase family protein [Peptoniphilus sp.]